MDYRSFDLNFEVNALLYSEEINKQMKKAFTKDLQNAKEICANDWRSRPKYIKLWEKLVRLLAPLL